MFGNDHPHLIYDPDKSIGDQLIVPLSQFKRNTAELQFIALIAQRKEEHNLDYITNIESSMIGCYLLPSDVQKG